MPALWRERPVIMASCNYCCSLRHLENRLYQSACYMFMTVVGQVLLERNVFFPSKRRLCLLNPFLAPGVFTLYEPGHGLKPVAGLTGSSSPPKCFVEMKEK